MRDCCRLWMSDPFDRLRSIVCEVEEEPAMIVLYEGGRDMGNDACEADALEGGSPAEPVVELKLYDE